MPDFVRVTDETGEYTTTRQWAEIADLEITDKDAVDVFDNPLPAKPKTQLPPAEPKGDEPSAEKSKTPAVANTKKES